jgi:hypothetical protein
MTRLIFTIAALTGVAATAVTLRGVTRSTVRRRPRRHAPQQRCGIKTSPSIRHGSSAIRSEPWIGLNWPASIWTARARDR